MRTRNTVTQSESIARAILAYCSNPANKPLDEREFYGIFSVRHVTVPAHIDAVNSNVGLCKDGIIRVKNLDACRETLKSGIFAKGQNE